MCNQRDKDLQTDVYAAIVLIFGVINLIVRATELILAIVSTCFMLGFLFSENTHAFHTFLNYESYQVLWAGPYPELSMSGNNSSFEEQLSSDQNGVQFRVSLQVWCGHLLWKTIIFAYGSLLVAAAKKRSYGLTIAWISFAISALSHYFLRFLLDLLTMDYFLRPIPVQVAQSVDIGFQIFGVLQVALLLNALHVREEKIQEIDRYNNNVLFKRDSGSYNADPIEVDGITIRPLENPDTVQDKDRY